MTLPPARRAAIVLCGGHSRRMGEAKASLPFGDETLLQRVVRRLGEAAETIVVVRAAGQTLPDLPATTLVVEDTAPDQGPLRGIATGFEALGSAADAAFVSSTDAPFVNPALVAHLFDLRDSSYDAVVPHALGHRHGLAAVYASTVLPIVAQMLSERRFRVMDLLDRLRTRLVDEDALRRIDPELLALSNVNTRDDYLAALKRLTP